MGLTINMETIMQKEVCCPECSSENIENLIVTAFVNGQRYPVVECKNAQCENTWVDKLK